MILGYSFIGLLLASLGGAAPGASNLAVIKTTSKDSLNKGMRIAFGAGVGEVLLAFMALCYSTVLTQFFEMNSWVQVAFIILFFVVGTLFYFSEKLTLFSKPKIALPGSESKFITGFILSVLNPPVLLFWILGITLTQKYFLPLTDMSSIGVLLLFFAGVFLGKVAILYFYAKLGNGMQKKKNTDASKLNRVIGIALVLLSTVQGIRFLIE